MPGLGTSSSTADGVSRRVRVEVNGVVQGVGFRPFVHRLASARGLRGFAANSSTGVEIEVEGPSDAIEQFLEGLRAQAPPLALITAIRTLRQPLRHEQTFTIRESVSLPERLTLVSPDVAACEECLKELYDPADRRFGYPFINCTNCGPRLTIIRDLPYDRDKTTMAGFVMCPECEREYHDPAHRRFHAQPNACWVCGPRLRVTDSHGNEMVVAEPIAFVAARLREGKIVAVKGLGGYHLACDALRDEVVRELRKRKHREAKPLAIMVPDLDTVRRLCEVGPLEAELLASPRRPIVLLRKRSDCPVSEEVAPRNRYLGVMLPYSPLHHLLLRQAAGPLVMTSGNLSEEPIAYEDGEAVARLAGIADYFLTHNRPIQMRCDDPVTRIVMGRELPLRRSRGYAPLPIRLSTPVAMPILACGGQLKNTFCLARGEHAFLSHHIGDLEDYRTYRSFVEGIEHFKRLFHITPEAVACDLHPGYLSTRYALSLEGLPHIAVQHHHAHIAACMAENGCEGPVIGVAWDGTGYGSDGGIWGGEFLVAEYPGFERLAHLEEVPLPGGEQAIRQPWRMAGAYLYHVYGDKTEGLDLNFVRRLDPRVWPVIRRMMARGINCPLTSSAGRLFDAVAALLGLRNEVHYEGQAAVELEMLAEGAPGEGYPFRILGETRPMVVETKGIIKGIVEDLTRGEPALLIAAKFHTTLAEIILQVCCRIRELTGLGQVALSGGAFQNVRLLTEAIGRLIPAGFEVYTHSQIPPNDGGIALGQAVVASAILAKGR